MNRLRTLQPHLARAAKVAGGVSCATAAVFHLQTRNCHFEAFDSATDGYFFQHPMFKQINPWDKPLSADSCVRQVSFDKLDEALLEDARTGGTQLIERFTQGLWGGAGFAIQRRIMEFTKNDANENDVWSREDLLSCKFDPGTYVTNHFLVLSKSPTSLFMRGCFDPHPSPPIPQNVDNVVEIRAEIDELKQVAVLKLRVATFDGTEQASNAEDPFGGLGGWLHRRYSSALVESGARNCMK